jgi:hypothetical protein
VEANSLNGTLPTEIGQWTNLETFLVYFNYDMSGTLPTEIGQCTSLQEITVISNGLSGTIPSELGELTSLEILDMGENDFEGTMPLGICDLRDGNLTLLSMYAQVTCFACSCCSDFE